MIKKCQVLIILCCLSNFTIFSQKKRPIPYPVYPTPAFNKAVDNKTRTHRGLPGESYWTNFTKYHIETQISPDIQLLQGTAKIIYFNNSPDTLHFLVLQLYQNLNKAESPKLRTVPITTGMQIASIKVNGVPQIEQYTHRSGGYKIVDTQMIIDLVDALMPGASIQLEIVWSFRIPKSPNPRNGQDGEVFFLAYWYPQVAVYDDLQGWDRDKYLGVGEFYMGYADYEVLITVPDNFLVGATGELQNASEILSPQSISRLEQAKTSQNTVHIVKYSDLVQNKAIKASKNHQHTWRFSARNVRDFAFGTSAKYLWDASFAMVDQAKGQKSLVHAFYRPERKYWDQAAHYGQYSLEFLSDQLWTYPWPQMTLVEGLIPGGMEFPMITLIGVDSNPYNLFSVTIHEIGHMWYPMLVGTDEKAYTWMDEGLTRYNQNFGLAKYFPEVDPWNNIDSRVARYYRIANTGKETAPMTHKDRFPLDPQIGSIASYDKPGLGLRALGAAYGEEQIKNALIEYGHRWSYKHPSPFDFFNTVEEFIGEDLDWFWTGWFYNSWTVDHSIGSVQSDAAGTRIIIEDLGRMPMSVLLAIHFSNGDIKYEKIEVDTWLKDQTSASILVPSGEVVKIILDPEARLPDIDRSNNIWVKNRLIKSKN